MTNHEHLSEPTKQILDSVSAFTAVASLLQWLPAVASVFTIVWTGIRIYDRINKKTDSQKD
jgi:hypothetical protein